MAEKQQLESLLNRLEREMDERRQGRGSTSNLDKASAKNDETPEERSLSKKASEAAKALQKERWDDTIEDLKRNPQDIAIYARYVDAVKQEIKEMRNTLDVLHAKKHERVWIHNRDSGDLDSRRLVDGLTGERNVYKRRGERPPEAFSFQAQPKRMTFLFDLSSSMTHYSMDGRLERSLEAATMILESFKGYGHKFALKFKGHSGSTDDVTIVDPNKLPQNDGERLDVLRAMNAHSASCDSGDHTLEATALAIKEIVKEPGDEYFVFLLSDANLEQYAITPGHLKKLLELDQRVNVFILFIGSIGDQARRLREELPSDKVFVTLDTREIPGVLRKVLTSTVLKAAAL